ncbi:IclR family transcriptional regulator [Pueribacillus theae]|uniref:IclR family transcriptional regulator n=1 Tax=Pueribacillus theae TaxID=2171751 RepID=UPI001403EADC|nr:IclR family transcriptional regulator [Pueribacillus theae]
MKNQKPKSIVPSVNKAIDIILLLSQSPDLSMKEIAETLELPSSTCFNILTTLEYRGFIKKNDKSLGYSLGLSIMRLGLQVYENIDIRKIALPIMKELTSIHNETCYLATLAPSKLEGFIIERVESSKTLVVLLPVGDKVPLYATATGKSLLSGFSEEDLTFYLNNVELSAFSTKTIITEEQLREELEQIRRKGYATTHNELGDGASAISCPIKDYEGNIIAAISLSGPTQRMVTQFPAMIQDVQEAANKISRSLQ